MILKTGNLYDPENFEKYDWVGFTANSVVKRDGSLVMGAGNAKVVRDQWIGSDKIFGSLVKRRGERFLVLSQTKVLSYSLSKQNYTIKTLHH